MNEIRFLRWLLKVASIAEWEELDAAMDATLSNHVANEASATQGAALLRVLAGVRKEVTFFKVCLTVDRTEIRINHFYAPGISA